jgi:hypothetical protein
MRHHAEDVAVFVEDAGDVVDRAVGVFAIAEGDLPFVFQFLQRLGFREIIAVAVGDDDA